jgi:hypothetical protein
MTEIPWFFLPENKSGLNQLCLKALQKVEAEISVDQLYCLQLADWALENRVFVHREDCPLEDVLLKLMVHKPALAMRELLEGEEDDPDQSQENREEILVLENETSDPKKLAVAVLSELDCQCRLFLPGYLPNREYIG